MNENLEPHKDHELVYTERATTAYRARISDDGEAVEAVKSFDFELTGDDLYCTTCEQYVSLEDVEIDYL